MMTKCTYSYVLEEYIAIYERTCVYIYYVYNINNITLEIN